MQGAYLSLGVGYIIRTAMWLLIYKNILFERAAVCEEFDGVIVVFLKEVV